VPEKLPFVIGEMSDSVFLQEIVYQEGRYAKPIKTEIRTINETQIRQERLAFEMADDLLKIGFWTENQIKKKAGSLNYNSWCQIKKNRRFPMEDTWGYYKIVYTIFFGEISKVKTTVSSTNLAFKKDYQTLLK
jgi:hypothetical protein